jgi:hypothetical protein
MTDNQANEPKLTLEEYEQAVLKLHRDQTTIPTKEQDRHIRQNELNLAIDYRLGKSFSAARRASLWKIQEQIEKKRLKLALKHLLRKIIYRQLYKDIHGLTGFMMVEYAKVLDENELKVFFDLDSDRKQLLPVVEDQLR